MKLQNAAALGAIVKRTIFCALILISFSFLFATVPGRCQEGISPTPPSRTGLPNAPSATQATTCTEKNGKPCPPWVHKLVGQYPPSSESREPQFERDPSTVHFWTYRGWNEP